MKEMDQFLRAGVNLFMQHEHITRRPIQIAKRVLLQKGTVTIRATPVAVRVGSLRKHLARVSKRLVVAPG
jgi:hypothetical protein